MITLKIGSRGEEVKILQTALKMENVDGIFGIKTDAAVRAFQKSKGLVVDGIVGNKTWAALGITETQPTTANKDKYWQKKRRITEIIIHCSATPEGKDYTVDDIRKWHLARGFGDVGYHFVIYRDGTVHKGRALTSTGAHCLKHNSNSIGICYIGGLKTDGKTPKDTRTEEQKKSIDRLVLDLLSVYPDATVHGHNEFANKACPSYNVKNELWKYKK